MRRSLPLASALALAAAVGAAASACVPTGSAEIALAPGELIVVATATDDPDVPAVDRVGSFYVTTGTAAFTAMKRGPFYLFRVRPEELTGAVRPLTAADLRAVRAKRASDPVEPCATTCARENRACRDACPSGAAGTECKQACTDAQPACLSSCLATATGECGRCLVPTTEAPMVVNPGDSCALPPFVEGHLYRANGELYETRDDAASTLAVTAARAAIRLDWPGACAANEITAAPSLAGLRIRPIAPVGAEWPASTVTEAASGLVAAVSDRIALAFDPRAPGAAPATYEIQGYEGDVRTSVGLRTGGVLVAGERYAETLEEGYRFDRLELDTTGAAPRITGLTPFDTTFSARPNLMKYVGSGPDAPLYLIGGSAGSFGFLEPGVFSCTSDPLQCARVFTSACVGDSLDLHDLVELPGGSGVGVSSRALFLKKQSPSAPGPGPRLDDAWMCHLPDGTFPWAAGLGGGEPDVKVSAFRAVANVGDRVFVCATREAPRCGASYAVVLTATVSAPRGEEPTPRWEVVAREADWSDCKQFVPVPGDAQKVRLVFSNGHTLDLDATGRPPASTGQIGALFRAGSLPWWDVRALASGNLLARARENAIYWSDGVRPFDELYGRPSYERATYGHAVPLDDGFLVLGHPGGLTKVTVTHGADAAVFPTTAVALVEDPRGLLGPSTHLRGLVVDHASTAESPGALVLLAVGYDDANGVKPLLERLWVRARTSSISVLDAAEPLVTPASLDGLAVDGVAETLPGQFVGIVQDTRVLQVDGDLVTELALDFDDPSTDDRESKPSLGRNECSGTQPRADAWHAIEAKNGVAWAVGSQGLIMRIAGGHATRFVPRVEETPGVPKVALTADVSAVRVFGPDQVLAAGHYDRLDGMGGRTLSVWRIAPASTPDTTCIPSGPPPAGDPQLMVKELAEGDCLNILHTIGQITYGYPRALLFDGTNAAVALDNGSLHRFSAQGLERIRVPFSILDATQNARGDVLFSGWESRLAVGVPAPKR